jgi:hypothetical protein
MPTEPYYERTRRIARSLEQKGFSDWAERLREAVDAASTGTELVMGVRWNLLELKKSGEIIGPDLDAQIDSLLAELDKALEP